MTNPDPSKLTAPQRAMLRKAANNVSRSGRFDDGYAWIGRGQTKTAKALVAAGLGWIHHGDYSAKFRINDEGREAVKSLG